MLIHAYKNLKKRKDTSKSYKSFNVVNPANVCGNSPVKLFEQRSLQQQKNTTKPLNPSALIIEKTSNAHNWQNLQTKGSYILSILGRFPSSGGRTPDS